MLKEINTKQYNFIYYIVANIFLILYIIVSVFLFITLTGKNNTQNVPIYLSTIYPLPFLFVFIGLYITGILNIKKLEIDKKNKLILLLFWILLNPSYIIVFLILFGLSKDKMVISNLEYKQYNKKIFNYSIVTFSFLIFLIFIYIMSFVLEATKNTMNKEVYQNLSSIFLVWLHIPTYFIILSMYLYLCFYGILVFNRNKKLSVLSFIFIANSFSWILAMKDSKIKQ